MMTTNDYLTDQEYNNLVADRDNWRKVAEDLYKIIQRGSSLPVYQGLHYIEEYIKMTGVQKSE
jgi:hypothetical protein